MLSNVPVNERNGRLIIFTAMKHVLVEIMSGLTLLSEEEKVAIEQCFPMKTFSKGVYLLREGQIAKDAYFLLKGCVREYKLADAEEKTTAFYTENQSVVNFNSITNQTPSTLNFVCEEDTTVAIVNAEKEKELYEKYPRFEAFCRSGVEQMIGAKQEQMAEFIALKPEQRYQKLQAERPDLLNRVPQYHIASFLGIKPETLSRIRARLVEKSKGI